jgi:hypothetical protein
MPTDLYQHGKDTEKGFNGDREITDPQKTGNEHE